MTFLFLFLISITAGGHQCSDLCGNRPLNRIPSRLPTIQTFEDYIRPYHRVVKIRKEYGELLDKAERLGGLPYNALTCLMIKESGGNRKAVGCCGGRGVFQIKPSTHRWMNKWRSRKLGSNEKVAYQVWYYFWDKKEVPFSSVYDLPQAMGGAATYLKYVREIAKEEYAPKKLTKEQMFHFSLWGYNAGPGSLRSHIRKNPDPEVLLARAKRRSYNRKIQECLDKPLRSTLVGEDDSI